MTPTAPSSCEMVPAGSVRRLSARLARPPTPPAPAPVLAMHAAHRARAFPEQHVGVAGRAGWARRALYRRRTEPCTLREIASKIGRRHEGMPVGLAGLVVAVREPEASFLHRIFDGGRRVHDACASAAAPGQHRLDGVLPGLPRRCAARSAEAAHAAARSSDEPPRNPWRGPRAL